MGLHRISGQRGARCPQLWVSTMPSHLTPNRFTTVGLTALPATGSSYDVSDAAVPRLLLRVGPVGTKRWLFDSNGGGAHRGSRSEPFP